MLVVGLLAAVCVAKEEDATADILKSLQDTGVLDSVKAELEKMLHDKDKMNELKDQILEKEKILKDKIAEQLKEPAKADEQDQKPDKKKADEQEREDYAISYVQEAGLKLSHDLIKHVSQIPSQASKKTVHFVQLSRALDELASAIGRGNIEEELVLKTAFKSVKQLREMIEKSDKEEKEVKKEEVKKAEPKKKRRDNEMSRAIRGFAAMAGNNPEMLVNAVLMGMSSYKLVSDDTIQIIRGYSHMVTKIEGLGEGIVAFAENLAWLVESEEGEKFFEILPLLADADQRDEAYERLREETKRQWSKFFNILNNSDVKRSFLVTCAEYMNAAHTYLVKDQMKMMVANAFLISQGLPPIAPKNLVESVIDLSDRCLRLFTTYKVDLKEYKAPVKAFFRKVESEYVQLDLFDKLDAAEQAELIAQFLDDNVVSTAQEVFVAHDLVYIKGRQECAESLLCSINQHAKGQQGSEAIRVQVAEGLTIALSWIWSHSAEDDVTVDKMDQAVVNGIESSEKCSRIYEPNYSKCKVFEWQNENVMSLNFDHQEL